MRSKADASSVILLLIPTSIVVVGLGWGLVVRSVEGVLSMLLLLGVLVLGFRQARRSQRRERTDGGC